MQWDGIGTALRIHFEGPPDIRLDSFLAEDLKGELSRSRVQSLIRDGFVKVNERTVTKPSHRLRVGDLIELEIPPPRGFALSPQEVPFGILYEDSSLAVIQKPAGIVVHPAPGHYEGTLVHGLLGRLKDLSTVGGVLRPGIVHRLDKGTSGVMLVAKNDKAHLALSSALKMGQIKKGYIAIAYSKEEIYRGKIELPIGRDKVHRKRMQIDPEHGRFASTEYLVLDKRDGIYLLYVKIKTGRTHQIRVHLSSQGIRILGDGLYGLSPRKCEDLKAISELNLKIERTMLHSYRIGFVHPETSVWTQFKAELPEDMSTLVRGLYSKDMEELDALIEGVEGVA